MCDRLKDDGAGVICGDHGAGGIGKTELAFAYAHAFAGAYPRRRFLICAEGKANLRDAGLGKGDFTALFGERISDGERKQRDTHVAAVLRSLRQRLDQLGHVLLVLDNVTDAALVSQSQNDLLTALSLAEWRAMGYAALLPPKEVPLPSLKALGGGGFPGDWLPRAAGRPVGDLRQRWEIRGN